MELHLCNTHRDETVRANSDRGDHMQISFDLGLQRGIDRRKVWHAAIRIHDHVDESLPYCLQWGAMAPGRLVLRAPFDIPIDGQPGQYGSGGQRPDGHNADRSSQV